MSVTCELIKRNCKLYFKDKGMFFSSMITPVILLVLYITFLAKVYRDIFMSGMPSGTEEKIINGLVGGQLFSSLMAVICITVAFCSNLITVQDKVTESIKDFLITPIKRSALAIGYYAATFICTFIVCISATGLCFIYIGATGWYMSAVDVLLIITDVFLLCMFGTALSSVVNIFLRTQGQMSAVGTIVSAGYGFICGAYMPLSQFGEGLRNTLMFLPGTYGTSVIRNHAMAGVFREMEKTGWPTEIIESIRDSVDCNIYFFGDKVDLWVSYLVVTITVFVLIGLYVLLNNKNFSAKLKNLFKKKNKVN